MYFKYTNKYIYIYSYKQRERELAGLGKPKFGVRLFEVQIFLLVLSPFSQPEVG